MLAGLGPAGERNLVDARVLDEGLTRDSAGAVDEVHDAARDARLHHEIDQPDRRERRQLGRLDDDGVAGGERGRELPDRERQGRVPRDDRGDDADRLAHRVVEHLGLVQRDGLAGEPVGPAREELQVLGGEHCLAGGERERHAVVLGADAAELHRVLRHELGQAEQGLAALGRRRRRPATLERLPRGGHGGIDLLDGADRDVAEGLPRRGVEVRDGLAGALDPLAGDEVLRGLGHLVHTLSITAAEPRPPPAHIVATP